MNNLCLRNGLKDPTCIKQTHYVAFRNAACVANTLCWYVWSK